MSGLEEAFYIVSLVYMGVMFALITILVITVLKIRNRINSVQQNIETKLDSVFNLFNKNSGLLGAVTAILAFWAKKMRKY